MKEDDADWGHVIAVTRPALALAPVGFLETIRANFASEGIQDAVARHDTPTIFDWIVHQAQYQGIGDQNASAFVAKHGIIGWYQIDAALRAGPSCPLLQSYWSFDRCGYLKAAHTCSEPDHLPACPLPRHAARKGSLSQAGYALFLFVSDVCDGDLVAWIDTRLAGADRPSVPDRATRMRDALLEPLGHVHGVGRKLWSMIMADLLLAGDPQRERWVTTGASMIAVDSLIHAYLHRTGCLHRLGAQHPYGDRCYGPGGCAEIVAELAKRTGAREINASYPPCFPRLVQHALWRFCAQAGFGICNGIRIDDRHRCDQRFCPSFRVCDRVPFKPA